MTALVVADVSERDIIELGRSLLPGSSTEDRPPPPVLAGRKVLASLAAEHPFVGEVRRLSPGLDHGMAVPRRFAAVWHPNRLLWWHEALHLLGARDCYDRLGRNRCAEPRCVMRAFAMTETGDGRLRLCGKDCRRVSSPPPPEDL